MVMEEGQHSGPFSGGTHFGAVFFPNLCGDPDGAQCFGHLEGIIQVLITHSGGPLVNMDIHSGIIEFLLERHILIHGLIRIAPYLDILLVFFYGTFLFICQIAGSHSSP